MRQASIAYADCQHKYATTRKEAVGLCSLALSCGPAWLNLSYLDARTHMKVGTMHSCVIVRGRARLPQVSLSLRLCVSLSLSPCPCFSIPLSSCHFLPSCPPSLPFFLPPLLPPPLPPSASDLGGHVFRARGVDGGGGLQRGQGDAGGEGAGVSV